MDLGARAARALGRTRRCSRRGAASYKPQPQLQPQLQPQPQLQSQLQPQLQPQSQPQPQPQPEPQPEPQPRPSPHRTQVPPWHLKPLEWPREEAVDLALSLEAAAGYASLAQAPGLGGHI